MVYFIEGFTNSCAIIPPMLTFYMKLAIGSPANAVQKVYSISGHVGYRIAKD